MQNGAGGSHSSASSAIGAIDETSRPVVNGHLSRGITKYDELVVRLDHDAAEKAATRKHARVCDLTGRPMRGMVLIEAPGFRDKRALESWMRPALKHARGLPPKAAEPRKR